ncbi:hypothetical protein D9M72_483360 [compost metagenome]
MQVDPALGHRADGRHQLAQFLVLSDIAARAGLQRQGHGGRAVVRRDDDRLAARMPDLQCPDEIEPVDVRRAEREIHENDVCRQGDQCIEQFAAGGMAADHRQAGLVRQPDDQAMPNDRVIIEHHQAKRLRGEVCHQDIPVDGS